MTEQQRLEELQAEREAEAIRRAAEEQRSAFMCLEKHVGEEDNAGLTILGVAVWF